MGKFAESLASKLGESWAATVLTPSFAFWTGGFLAWAYSQGWSDALERSQKWLLGRPDSEQWILLFVSLGTIAASGSLVQRLDLAMLRGLEGYWPKFLNFLNQRLTRNHERRIADNRQVLQDVGAKEDSATKEELRALAKAEMVLAHYPADANAVMPTRLGNIIRAGEIRSREKYGLDAVVVWPRMWLVLDADVKNELQGARAHLDSAVRFFTWALLFSIWTFFTAWALVVPLVGGLLALRATWREGETYAQLLESTFDVHRFLLYESLRWPLPIDPSQEQVMGVEITSYLWRGSSAALPKFTHDGERET